MGINGLVGRYHFDDRDIHVKTQALTPGIDHSISI
jgi:hypothetical protein